MIRSSVQSWASPHAKRGSEVPDTVQKPTQLTFRSKTELAVRYLLIRCQPPLKVIHITTTHKSMHRYETCHFMFEEDLEK